MSQADSPLLLAGAEAPGEGGAHGSASVFSSVFGPRISSFFSCLEILICSSDSIEVRQMGHLLDCIRSTLAHSLHMHMCRQGRIVVSRGSVMQMTHLVKGVYGV